MTPEEKALQRLDNATSALVEAREFVEKAVAAVRDGHYDERAAKAEALAERIQTLVRDCDNLYFEYIGG